MLKSPKDHMGREGRGMRRGNITASQDAPQNFHVVRKRQFVPRTNQCLRQLGPVNIPR